MLSRLLACALLSVGAACADPDGKFDDFVRRSASDDPEPDAGPMADGGALPTAEQASGTFLSVVSSNISPKKPVVYRLEVTAVQKGDMLELTMVDQPLSYMDRMTPVGEKSPPRTILVPPTGSYTEMLMKVVTPGDANPVLPGTATLADTTFHGAFDAAETDGPGGQVLFWCGTLTGHLYEPLEQDISGTFTISRIVDGVSPPVVINCAKDAADPL